LISVFVHELTKIHLIPPSQFICFLSAISQSISLSIVNWKHMKILARAGHANIFLPKGRKSLYISVLIRILMTQFTLSLVTILVLAAGLSMLLSSLPFAHAVDVPSSVQLGGTTPTCGLQVVSGSPINYGQLATANSISAEKSVRVQNTGTSPGSLTALGTQWTSPTAPAPGVVMNVGTTHAATSANVAYASKVPLATTAVTLIPSAPGIAAGASVDTFWQVQFVSSAGAAFTGTASQTLTLSSSC
jgi:hypothetical protein